MKGYGQRSASHRQLVSSRNFSERGSNYSQVLKGSKQNMLINDNVQEDMDLVDAIQEKNMMIKVSIRIRPLLPQEEQQKSVAARVDRGELQLGPQSLAVFQDTNIIKI